MSTLCSTTGISTSSDRIAERADEAILPSAAFRDRYGRGRGRRPGPVARGAAFPRRDGNATMMSTVRRTPQEEP
jgi:hypothetical protein